MVKKTVRFLFSKALLYRKVVIFIPDVLYRKISLNLYMYMNQDKIEIFIAQQSKRRNLFIRSRLLEHNS
jgi:hypothetical protein